MDSQIAYIALGSNLEPRSERLAQARLLLSNISEGDWQESSIHETEPVGPPGQGPYLNQVICFRSSRNSLQLLHFCKGVETILGRKIRGRWESREIDLDLLYHGSATHKSPSLVLPHPRIAERTFVLRPLSEIAPDMVDPLSGQSITQMLRKLEAA